MPRCPICFVPMTRTEEEGLRAHTCPSCFGRWMPTPAVFKRLRLDVDHSAADSGGSAADEELRSASLVELAALVAESNSRKAVRCPECEKPMAKDRFQQMIPVTIDRCKHCQRTWFDTGEYNLIRKLYVELTTSTDPQIVQMRDKVALASMQWEARTTLTQAASRSVSVGTDVADLTMDVLFGMLRV